MADQNKLKWGDHNIICDVCGFKKKSSDIRERWDGLFVCEEDWEQRHPQDFIRGMPDDQSVPFARPDSDASQTVTDVGGNTLVGDANVNTIVGDANVTLTLGTDDQVVVYSTALTANRTITLTAGDGPEDIAECFKIYRTAGGAFTLDVGGLYTIPVSVNQLVTVQWDGTTWVLRDVEGLI